MGIGEEFPLPISRLGMSGGASYSVSSLSGVWGRAMAENGFGTFLA